MHKEAAVSVRRVASCAGFSAGQLKEARFSAKDVKDAGFRAASAFTLSELRAGGFTVKDLKARRTASHSRSSRRVDVRPMS